MGLGRELDDCCLTAIDTSWIPSPLGMLGVPRTEDDRMVWSQGKGEPARPSSTPFVYLLFWAPCMGRIGGLNVM
jgi:hypothetical protein